MKLDIKLFIAIIVSGGLVALIFTAYQISLERQKLRTELEVRTASIAGEFNSARLDSIDRGAQYKSEQIADSVIGQYGFTAMAIYYNTDSILMSGERAKPLVNQSEKYISQALSSDSSMGNFIKAGASGRTYAYIKVIHREHRPELALIYYVDARYIEDIIRDIWSSSFFRWFLQAILIAGITLLIIRRNILMPLNKVVDWVKAARFGKVDQLKEKPALEFLHPLYKEISGIAQAMQEAQAVAREEAQLRTSAESVWTPERLRVEMKQILESKMMVVVSNREPYMHIHNGNEIQCIVPASGMVTAMEPILKACGGLWIASGSGDADRETVDEHDKVMVPPFEDKYTLRRIWLSKEEEQHFYYGFSNEGLWPLCHIAHTRPVFRKIDWDHYKAVNEKYAEAVLKEIRHEDEPFVLVQDYHFALLPKMIKSARPDARVAIFWHIPWPNPESFGICPWQKEILSGLLGADLIGFHTQFHCNNFLETVNNSLESRVIWDNFSVKMGTHFTLVKAFPISIAFTLKDQEEIVPAESRLPIPELLQRHGIHAKYMGIGVDRIDYTKGLLEKFLSIETFLDKYPEYVNEFTFVQIGAPSRSVLKTYADTIHEVELEAERINARFRSRNWQPIVFLKGHHSHDQIMPYYRSANICMVTSLHDGMNLVAKEFIAARSENDGVLILSQFAGASQELHGALVINPYDIERSADAIKTGLEMPYEQQQQKMKQMRRLIMRHNIYSWGANILRTMATIEN
jgi:trehalose 6-phosphate synthase